MPPSHRLTISIPAPLAERLDSVKDSIVISNVCADALERAVDTQLALREKPALERAIARLRSQRLEREQTLRESAYRSGWRWVLEEADYSQIEDMFIESADEEFRAHPLIDSLPDIDIADYKNGDDLLGTVLSRMWDEFGPFPNAYDDADAKLPVVYEAYFRGMKDAWSAIRDEVLRG